MIAAENNPGIQAAYAEFEAALQQAPQVSSLPDPTLTVSAFGRMVETRLGPQEARFSLMQMFPWFGTLEAREDAATLMAEAKFQRYLDIRMQVLNEVKEAYAQLYEISEKIELQEENLKILDTYKDLSLSKLSSGSTPMVNVIKIDIEREANITEIELLKHHLKPMERVFNLLLNRDIEAAVEITEDLSFIEPELADESQLFATHPSVEFFEKQKESFEAEEKVARKEGFPMMGLGLEYSIISNRTDANPIMNGQDAIMPTFSMTLPIFRKKYKAAKKEAEYLAAGAEQEKQMQKNELRSIYEMTLHEIKTAEKYIDLFDRQIKHSTQAKSLLNSAFSSSTGQIEELLEMNQKILMLRIKKVEAITNGFIAAAKMEYLLSKNEKK